MHIFIFVMALFHILVGIGLIVVSSFRMRRWRMWTEQDDPQAHSTLCDDTPTIIQVGTFVAVRLLAPRLIGQQALLPNLGLILPWVAALDILHTVSAMSAVCSCSSHAH